MDNKIPIHIYDLSCAHVYQAKGITDDWYYIDKKQFHITLKPVKKTILRKAVLLFRFRLGSKVKFFFDFIYFRWKFMDFLKGFFANYFMKKDDTHIGLYTDLALDSIHGNEKRKYALLLEPPAIDSRIYQLIRRKNHLFKKVLTFNKELLDLGDNYEFYPTSDCWISKKDKVIHKKSKLCSIIVSEKKGAIGQALRHKIVNTFKGGEFDVYGRAYKYVKNKTEALNDYFFSITIENSKIDYYFTEKIMDCFATGTIPIYWGCPSIGNFFDIDGIITFNDEKDLKNILETLNEDEYYKRLDAVKRNFKLATETYNTSDWFYDFFKKELAGN